MSSYKLTTNKFRVINPDEFENFIENIVVQDLEVLRKEDSGEVYFSFMGNSPINGWFNGNEVEENYDVESKLQEFLNSDDEIIIKLFSDNEDVEATIITKKDIRGINLDEEIGYLIESMRDDE